MEPCKEILEGSQQAQERVVQEVFRADANHQSVEYPPSAEKLEHCSLTDSKVSAVLAGHVEWDQGSTQRMVPWLAQGREISSAMPKHLIRPSSSRAPG